MKEAQLANRIIFYITFSLIFLGFPLIFSLLEIPSNTEKFVMTITGSVLAVSSIAVVLLDGYVLYSKTDNIYKVLPALRGVTNWIPLFIGLFVFFALFTNLAPTIGLIIGIFIWLVILLLTTLVTRKRDRIIKMKLEGVDLFSIFKPETSTALNIIQVRGAHDGNLFQKYLLNENCTVEKLEHSMHGGRLRHIQKNSNSAYAKTTNITIDNEQRFQNSAFVKPDDNHLWDIDIAFLEGTTPLLIAVERALLEMKNHHRVDSMICTNVGLYQRFSKLITYIHDLRRAEYFLIETIGYHKNIIEFQSIHRYSDSDIEWSRSLTITNSDRGIFVDDRAINEDVTVSLPNVPVEYFKLPFEQCRLYDIVLNLKGKSVLILYLILSSIEHKDDDDMKILSIKVSEDNSAFKLVDSIPETAISARDFVKQQATYNIEILNQHPTSDEIETFITGNHSDNEINAIFNHKSPEEQQRISHRLGVMAKKAEGLSDFLKTD